VSSFANEKQTSFSRTLGFAEAMVHQTLQTGLCPCGDAELDQTASAMIGNKIRRSLRNNSECQAVFDRLLECVDERSSSSAIVALFYTSRRSEAKPR
jgi:hypothetical protein